MKRVLIVLLLSLFTVALFSSDEIAEVRASIDVFTGQKAVIEVKYNIPEGFYQSLQEDYFGIDIEHPSITLGKTIYPATDYKDGMGYAKYVAPLVLQKEITIARNAPLGEQEIEVVFFYQLCDSETNTCLIPEETSLFMTLNIQKGSGGGSGSDSNAMQILWYLALAFIGGVILNFMPCVLPILSIRAFNIVKQSQNSRKNIFINSMLYTLGIVVSFIAMATVVVILKLSGEMIGWGFQFQNTGFVVFLLTIMYVFSLSLFDVFVLQIPGFSGATKASGQSGYLGSFMMGIFCVLLATPCTAPFLGAALGFAFSQTPLIIYAIFFLVGVGLGFPFILIGLFPSAVKILPKPGEWMNIFKEFLGFLLLIFAIIMINTLLALMGGSYLIRILYYILTLSFAAWLYGRFVTPMHSKATQWIATIVAILVIIFGYAFILHNQQADDINSEMKEGSYWSLFSEEAVAQGLAEGRPVFVNFTAAYCTICKTNEFTVFMQSDMQAAFAEKNVLMLKGDMTRRNDVMMEWLRRYDRAGVPLYLLFVPGRDEPERFPEALAKPMLMNALNRI